MSRQVRLLLCSSASVALIAGALFALEWFKIELGPATIAIGLRSMDTCVVGEGCTTTGLAGMRGFYPFVSAAAYWLSLPLALLVLGQAGSRLVTGSASMILTKLGYTLGCLVFVAAFFAGYLFGPETDGVFEMMGMSITHTFAPPMLMAGSMLAILAVRYAVQEASDDSAEYKPIVLRKDGDEHLPVNPHDVKPVSQSGRIPTPPGPRDRIPTPGSFERIPLPGRAADGRIPTPPARDRIATPPARERLPDSYAVESDDDDPERTRPSASSFTARTRDPSNQPLVARTTSPGARTRDPSDQPLVARTTSPSGRARTSSEQPLVARTTSPGGRARTSSEQPLVARTSSSQSGERIKSPSQPGDRTRSPSQPGDRSKSPSQPGDRSAHGSDPGIAVDPVERSRTSSSGPIDMAARLAPLSVAIRPPLPERAPVPPDQIPVAPESGLVIRKRTASAGPLSTRQVPMPTQAQAPSTPAASADPAIAQPAAAHPSMSVQASMSPQAPKAPVRIEPRSKATGRTPPGAMPSIALRSLSDDIGDFDLTSTPLPPVMPPIDEDEMSGLGISFEPTPPPAGERLPGRPGSVTATGSSPPGTLQPTLRPKLEHAGPAMLRGKLKYALTTASLTSAGISAEREDGTTKLVIWDSIVGIIARRLPAEAPYGGATFVDIVSDAGSTLRILPWTHIEGAPVLGADEDRARGIVNLVAARCLDAKLDSWTKVFADGVGHAAQLPSARTLAAHDERLA